MKFVEFTLAEGNNKKIMVDANLIQGLEGDEEGCSLFVTIDNYRERYISIKESYEQASALLRSI